MPPRSRTGAPCSALPFFIIPFGALLAVLFGTGYTPQYAAGVAIFAPWP